MDPVASPSEAEEEVQAILPQPPSDETLGDDDDSFPYDRSVSMEDNMDEMTPVRRSLEEENANLRSELKAVKKELERLQRSTSNPPVISRGRNLSKTSQDRTSRSQGHRRKEGKTNFLVRKVRRRRSISSGPTDDNAPEVEPDHSELHESARGLHSRKSKTAKNEKYTSLTQQDQDDLEGGISDDYNDDDDYDDDAADQVTDQIERTPGLDEGLSFCDCVSERAGWLVGLLILQSMSSFIISRNEKLLQAHLVIVRFLTMLVGAGGNAGNQASVRVIRGLATGAVNPGNLRDFLIGELKMALALSSILGLAGCIRAAVFLTPLAETVAITTSLYAIVFISIVLGALLPLAMKYVRIDPAHSSTTIQVLMDILGVSITVYVCSLILDSAFAAMYGEGAQAGTLGPE